MTINPLSLFNHLTSNGITFYTGVPDSLMKDFNNAIFDNTTEKQHVITANEDNVNDKIEVEKYVGNCSDFSLTVRDRWGNQVYVQERGEPSFNGNSILGEKLPEGVYFYKLTHSQGSKTGFIHLLK